MRRTSIDRPLLENPEVPTLPAFVRVEHGLPWGHWVRFDSGALVLGTINGLGLTLADPSLAPSHAVFHHLGEALMVEALRADAELRVDGVPKRLAHLDEPCSVSLGETHLQVLPPPRTVSDCSNVLRVLRGWLEPDPATGLPTAAHLGEALHEGCGAPEGECQQALLLVRPENPDRGAARTLRRALPADTLLCRAGPEHLAAWLPEGPPDRLCLPPTWQLALQPCARGHHQPGALLSRALAALPPRPTEASLSSTPSIAHHLCS